MLPSLRGRPRPQPAASSPASLSGAQFAFTTKTAAFKRNVPSRVRLIRAVTPVRSQPMETGSDGEVVEFRPLSEGSREERMLHALEYIAQALSLLLKERSAQHGVGRG